MNHFILFVICVLTCVLFGVPACADEPPKKLTPEERSELDAKAKALSDAGFKAYRTGQIYEAVQSFTDALLIARRLYPNDEYPDGHAELATSLNNLAGICQAEGRYADAEPLYREALAMFKRLYKGDHLTVATFLNNLASLLKEKGRYAESESLYQDALAMQKRLFKGDHLDVATSLNNLSRLYQAQGRYADAEPLCRNALDMFKRLFKGDHSYVATSLNNLGLLYQAQRKYADAEPVYRESLEIQKRLFKGDHPNVAATINNLATMYQTQERLAEAESLYCDALAMRKRLFKGDHSNVATSLHNLASLYQSQGKYADAEPFYRDAIEMRKRLFKGDHPNVSVSLNNLATVYQAQGKYADAETLYRDALTMTRRLIASYAMHKSEGETLTLLASLPLTRDLFLSNSLKRKSDPRTVYTELWASKGLVARVYEGRQQAARAVASDPKAAKLIADLADNRRRRAELILAPEVKDPATRKKREEDIKNYEQTITELDRAVRPLLPTIARTEKLESSSPTELLKAIPTDAAIVDFLRYTFLEFDKDKPGTIGEKRTARYLAFVVTKDSVIWLDLDTAENIEAAVTAWREAITSGNDIPVGVPLKVRNLVWEKVRKELPAAIKTVYISPDTALCRVPWGAMPGDKPGTILLENYTVATIPHATFLLDKLWLQDSLKYKPEGALVVGGVKYDKEFLSPSPDEVSSRGNPLVKPGATLGWSFLPGTSGEATGVAGAALSKKLAVTALKDEKATAPAVLAALPKAKYAHFATHGFFADSSFRSVFQLDEKDYEQSRLGERIGRAANSPLVMTGLVFAGANNPKTPGRGILTGEALIDLDLSGLELAVLSACETGLGDMAGGEGTFGLQRAFHLAGTRDVVASLWKVPDQSTAALMALFYRNLWTLNLSPIESLRQAQLEIYRNPARIPELSKGFRGKFDEVPGTGGEIKPTKDEKAHPLLWAAFTLSGPGR